MEAMRKYEITGSWEVVEFPDGLPSGLSEEERERLREIESLLRTTAKAPYCEDAYHEHAAFLRSLANRPQGGDANATGTSSQRCGSNHVAGGRAGDGPAPIQLCSLCSALTDSPSQPDAPSVPDQSQGSVDGLVETLEGLPRFVPDLVTEPIPDGIEYVSISPHRHGDLLRRVDVLDALANYRGGKQ